MRFRERYVPGSGKSGARASNFFPPPPYAPEGGSDLISWGKPPRDYFEPVEQQTTAPGVPPLMDTTVPEGADPATWNMMLTLLRRAVIKAQQIYLPNVQPIPGVSVSFQAYGLTTTSAAGEIAIPGAELVIPNGDECIVQNFNIFIGSTTALTFNTQQLFSIEYNESKLPSATNLTTFGRPVQTIEYPFENLGIYIPRPGTLQAVVNNVDGGSYVVGAFFTGWYHPQIAAIRWKKGLSLS